MRVEYVGIVHLREPARGAVRAALEPALTVMRGVAAVRIADEEPLITIEFDSGQIGLAQIVRTIEDNGAAVSGVAQRPAAIQ